MMTERVPENGIVNRRNFLKHSIEASSVAAAGALVVLADNMDKRTIRGINNQVNDSGYQNTIDRRSLYKALVQQNAMDIVVDKIVYIAMTGAGILGGIAGFITADKTSEHLDNSQAFRKLFKWPLYPSPRVPKIFYK